MAGRAHPPPENDGAAALAGARGAGDTAKQANRNPSMVADELPDHRGARRRFLIVSCSLGLLKPERLVDDVLRELEREVL